MVFDPAFKAHLTNGSTTVARAWEVQRNDGQRMGFTDHDQNLVFDGLEFRADGGFSARVLASSTGLAVDNGEALGALSDEGIREADIEAGRFDGAWVKAWLVNWQNPAERTLQFKGTIGEIIKLGGEFRAEIRGLAEELNIPKGRVFQSACSAVLGDSECGIDLSAANFSVQEDIIEIEAGQRLKLPAMPEFAQSWFERGRLEVLGGSGAGVSRVIKRDREEDGGRWVELWQALPQGVEPGAGVRLEAGCDKRGATCKVKFSNYVNFRGFPHIPGEDWLLAYPRGGDANDGGSRYS